MIEFIVDVPGEKLGWGVKCRGVGFVRLGGWPFVRGRRARVRPLRCPSADLIATLAEVLADDLTEVIPEYPLVHSYWTEFILSSIHHFSF